jgi:hypothetical protein
MRLEGRQQETKQPGKTVGVVNETRTSTGARRFPFTAAVSAYRSAQSARACDSPNGNVKQIYVARGEGFIMHEDAAPAVEERSASCGPEDVSLLAIHEAGHAVIGLALGFRILRVSIDDAAGTADFAALRPKMIHGTPTPRLLRTLEAYGEVCLAGPSAELWSDPHAFNLEDYDWPDAGGETETSTQDSVQGLAQDLVQDWAQDVTEVKRLAAKLGQPDWFRAIARRTRELVEQHWPAIEAVADALLRQGTLSESELLALVPGEKRAVPPQGRNAPNPRGATSGDGGACLPTAG